MPGHVVDSASAGIVSLLGHRLGICEPALPSGSDLGPHLLVAAVVVIAVKVARDREISVGLATALAIAISYWVLLGLNRGLPAVSRYQYPSAIFLLLIAGETMRGLRVPRVAIVGAGAITGLAIVGGISVLHEVHDNQWRPFIEAQRSRLRGPRRRRGSRRPQLSCLIPSSASMPVRTYYDATAKYGSPAYTESELQTRPDDERSAADLTIAQALGLEIAPPSPGTRIVSCQSLKATRLGETGITLLHGGFEFENRGNQPVDLSIGRFSSGLPVDFGSLEPGAPVSLYIPRDESTRPWRLGLIGSGPVRLCTTG